MATLTRRLAGNVTTVFNGTSMIGMNLIPRLAKAGSQMVIAYRGSIYDNEHLKVAAGPGQVFFSHYHLQDEDSLREAMRHSNIVVNTVGKMNETRNFSFWDVHVEGPRLMARVAREMGVEKFIHISAMNCSPHPTPWVLKNGSQFLRTKYYGELAVREEFPEAIIFRPSDIVGERDSFVNHFTSTYRSRYTYKCPLWDYYDGVEKQPVFIRDLNAAIEAAILNDSANGKTFQAVGPHRYRLYDLVEYIRASGGQGVMHYCEITNMRWDLLRFTTSILERIQKYPFITWERVERDCISDEIDPKLPTLKELGIRMTPIERVIEVLAFARPREQRVEYVYETRPIVPLPERLDETRAAEREARMAGSRASIGGWQATAAA